MLHFLLLFLGLKIVTGFITPQDWLQYNHNLKNDRWVSHLGLSPSNIRRVSHKCDVLFTAGESTSARHQAQPIIVDNVMYISGNYGLLKAIDLSSKDCKELWSFNVREEVFGYQNLPDIQARVTPAYYEKKINHVLTKGKIVSIAPGFILTIAFNDWLKTPMKMFQIDAETGTLDWAINITAPANENIEESFMSSWSAPTIQNGIAYFGLSGAPNIFDTATLQFFLGAQYPYRTIGLTFAVDLVNDGVILWKVPTLPRKPQDYNGKWFSGAGVWSSPSIVGDKVLFGTGQLYSVTNVTENCLSTISPNAQFGTTYKGETGEGVLECYQAGVSHAKSQGSTVPLAAGSTIALNKNTGNFIWSQNLIGIDTWLVPCGLTPKSGTPGCDTPVPGPDWDVNSAHGPVIIKFRGKDHIFSHSKGGLIFILDPDTGSIIEKWDVCHGSAVGGIHFGFSYDRVTHRLIVPCAAGLRFTDLNNVPNGEAITVKTLANGDKICQSGHLVGIDLDTEKVSWQVVPAGVTRTHQFSVCQNTSNVNSVDERFKYNIGITKDFKNLIDPSVNVVYYDGMINSNYPLQHDYKSSIHTPGIIGNGMIFWTTAGGKVYVTDVRTGDYLHDLDCPSGGGGLYGAGALISGKRIMFGCGDETQAGNKVRVYEF